MCGIMGYIGNKFVDSLLVAGLERLEYRGYDSSGIATMESNKIVITKTSGKVSDLVSLILDDHHKGNIFVFIIFLQFLKKL